MKKNSITLIEEFVTTATKRGVAHLQTEDEVFNGREITINKRKLLNFGLCSYFGLEIDLRLKEAAKDAIDRYGIHHSCSRAYATSPLYKKLEELVSEIFDAPVVLSTSLSLGHHAVMPVVVGEKDAIILDQQVHTSVQDAALKMQGIGTKVTIVRHNDLEDLKKN